MNKAPLEIIKAARELGLWVLNTNTNLDRDTAKVEVEGWAFTVHSNGAVEYGI